MQSDEKKRKSHRCHRKDRLRLMSKKVHQTVLLEHRGTLNLGRVPSLVKWEIALAIFQFADSYNHRYSVHVSALGTFTSSPVC